MKKPEQINVVTLRKLTTKSRLGFGKYSELTVMEVIDTFRKDYLRWVYFNVKNIDFMDDILQTLGIIEKFRIAKPGVSAEKYSECLKDMKQFFEEHNKDSKFNKIRGAGQICEIKTKRKANLMRNKRFEQKGNLQRINQGHK